MKLWYTTIRRVILTVSSSSLSNRFQYVSVGIINKLGKIFTTAFPQGSVLGPLLFALYLIFAIAYLVC